MSERERDRETDRTHDHRPMMTRISEEERQEKEREGGREKEREIKQVTHSSPLSPLLHVGLPLSLSLSLCLCVCERMWACTRMLSFTHVCFLSVTLSRRHTHTQCN